MTTHRKAMTKTLPKTLPKTLAATLAIALIATPIFAQRGGGDRLSRECRQQVMQLCARDGGRDRAKIRACLQEKFSELSDECSAELQERMQGRGGEGGRGNRAGGQRTFQPTATVSRTVIYGSDRRQQIDVYEPEGAVDDLPLILHIHGGGWSFGNHKLVQSKPTHFNKAGYYFASTGYRLMPDAPVEEQAKDIGAALQALRGQATAIGFDPDRIVVMGHSAGAHLAALVATDPQYAGDAFNAIKGVILLDGAGYDIASSISAAEPRARNLYLDVFGEDAARQAALSPVTHVGEADAPNWLALYVVERERAKMQAELLTSGLIAAGVSAQTVAISNTDHGRMNRELGTDAGADQTAAVDAFLTGVFG